MSISNQLIKLNDIKTAIREALAAKGAAINETTLFSQYAALIKKLTGIEGLNFTEIITDYFGQITDTIPDTIYSSSSFNQITDTVEETETESEEE